MSTPSEPTIANTSAARSPFTCLGLDDAPDREILEKMVRAAKPFRAGDGEALLLWLDASGAGMGFHYASGGFQCYKPWFAAGRTYRLLPKSWIADAECRFCDRLVADLLTSSGDVACRLALEVENIELVREQVVMNAPVSCEIAAFAKTISVGDGASQANSLAEGKVLAPHGIVAADNGSVSEARITGRVLASERRMNALNGGCFVHLSVEAGPLSFEILSADLPQLPAPGAMIQSECWLIAQIREKEQSKPSAVICMDCS